jgi:hypothetical protein
MSYIAKKRFQNESVNYILDSFMENIVKSKIGLGGRAAENMYASSNTELNNIVLVTNDDEVMEHCRLQKDFFKAKQVFHYENRSIYYTDVFCLEIWLDGRTTFNTLSGISVQVRADINPDTL